MNIPLLRSVQEAILKEPGRLEMSSWFSWRSQVGVSHAVQWDDIHLKKDFTGCNTAACIAGHAISCQVVAGHPNASFNDVINAAYDLSRNPERVARTLLDLEVDQATMLFNVGLWPLRFMEAYTATLDDKEKAKIAVKRIEFFIQTNGTDNEDYIHESKKSKTKSKRLLSQHQ